ncbi:hypothetical protein AAG570_002755 [Ranatra chinensis]|uniref:Uncharacterized protein n=1 Tax=Ranatra chinensis TaxID=642074 RepID=A0ABD0Y5X7_9HEMI
MATIDRAQTNHICRFRCHSDGFICPLRCTDECVAFVCTWRLSSSKGTFPRSLDSASCFKFLCLGHVSGPVPRCFIGADGGPRTRARGRLRHDDTRHDKMYQLELKRKVRQTAPHGRTLILSGMWGERSPARGTASGTIPKAHSSRGPALSAERWKATGLPKRRTTESKINRD